MTNDSPRGPQTSIEKESELRRARDRMIARDRLIDEMVENNERQIKNEHARGGAEIELACARREAAGAQAGAAANAELDRAAARLEALRQEHRRLVAEREWLNTSLREIDNGPSSDEHERSGHA
ncbi:hypothetical protein CI1B_78980 [Bradyrhizobium ivorense]|uniref:Chromosome partition protein Smc n=1 Tax=Bradyrhizobium ivorense TaxID=2511166 RepID=A0A508TY25_9BRAD|nr:hypothetical protein [Bradyrhizobium ivorense]VIO79565.1 hypothetical protein CI1B_78980 [Bradyrhizobium ivorense]